MDQWLAQSVDMRRFNLRVIGVFALTALLLAAIGVYGVAAEGVALRTREIGVRAALGATAAQLIGAVMKDGLVPVMCGALAGVIGALLLMNALRSFLYRHPIRSPDLPWGLPGRRGVRALRHCMLRRGASHRSIP